MAAIKKYKPGEFCWTDLGVKDFASAKKFYKGLFGWKFAEYPMGEGAVYAIVSVGGKEVCGVYTMAEAQKKLKAPPYWLPYISVKSTDATAKKAKAAGGKIITKPTEVMDKGRMAVIQDPTGAVFALWEPRTSIGAGLDGKPGTVCWHDLSTPKPSVAGKFYEKAIGWKTKGQKYSGNEYHLFTLGRKGVCGMWPGPMPKQPPSWITYWQVSSCAKSAAKVKKLGGRVLMGTITVPKMCRFAVVRDPQGAVFGLLEPIG